MSGLLGGIANLAGALSQGNDLQAQERVKSALQQAQITRQGQDDQLKQVLAQRQADQARQKDAITLALHGYVAPHAGTGDGQQIPNAAFGLGDVTPGVKIGTETYDYDPNLDPTHQRLAVQQEIAQGRNDVSTANNIRTTDTSRSNNQNTVAASVGNNMRTTATSAANNQRTTATSAANNANTVAGKKNGAGSAGGGSAQDKRAKSYVDLMVHSLPTMQAKADKVRPEAISFALAHSTAGNYLLNDDEQQYMQAARDFLAGVLHQESGAKLTDSQVKFGIQRYVPLAGDSKAVRAQKLAAAQQVMEERRADYSGVGGDASTPTTEQTSPPASTNVTPNERAALKAQGFSDEQIDAL